MDHRLITFTSDFGSQDWFVGVVHGTIHSICPQALITDLTHQIPPGNIRRAAVELAKEWRTDRALRRLEAMLLVGDREHVLVVSGNGDVIEPDDGIATIGSGGSYALAAARALVRHTEMSAREVAEEALRLAAEICIYTNDTITAVELP